MGFPGGAAVKNLPADTGGTGDEGSTPGPGRSPGLGNGNPLQYSWLQNSMDRGAWWATIHGVAKSQPWLNTHARHCAITPDPADLRLGYLLNSPWHDTALGLASTFPHVSLSSRADGLSVTNLWYEVVWLTALPASHQQKTDMQSRQDQAVWLSAWAWLYLKPLQKTTCVCSYQSAPAVVVVVAQRLCSLPT